VQKFEPPVLAAGSHLPQLLRRAIFLFRWVGARLLRPSFTKTWRELDAVIGLTIVALAARLVWED